MHRTMFARHLLLLFLLISLPAPRLRADGSSATDRAEALLAEVVANRPAHDLALTARLLVNRTDQVTCKILIQNRPNEVRTLYRTGDTEALVIQPLHARPRYFIKGQGEVTGEDRYYALAGSQFRLYDLGLPFLHWDSPTLLEPERYRGRTCEVVEVQAPDGPYRKARLVIDTEFRGLLRAELFNEHGDVVRTFSVTSFKRIGDVWIPRGMEMTYRPPGQSLPSAEKSRLDVYEGNETATLAAEEFDPDRF